VCGQVDDHPRHVIGLDYLPVDQQTPTHPDAASKMIEAAQATKDPNAVAAIIAHVQDNTTTLRHFDCCRSVGCPDGSCNVVTKGAEDLRGSDLQKHLTGSKAQKAAVDAGLLVGSEK
jgi:hypothetical protein